MGNKLPTLDIFREEMIIIEKNSKKHVSNIQHFEERNLIGNSSFVLTRIFNLSECNAIECFNILENQVKVLYLPKEMNTKHFEICLTDEKEIFYNLSRGIDSFELKSKDLESSDSKEYHSSTDFPLDTFFFEYQCEILHHFEETNFDCDFNISKGIILSFAVHTRELI
jgi:hypothetical protein